MEPTVQHPSDLDLELARIGEAEEGVRSHLVNCSACSRKAAMLHRLSEVARQASPPVEIPELVEARILREARQAATHVQSARRPRWVAVAAAAVLVFALTVILRSPLRSPAQSADLNGDGVTDILDAYRLAMWVEAGEAVHPIADLDGNGRIDRKDVDSLAMSIVRGETEISQ